MTKNLHLSSYSNADEILHLLENHFGTQTAIAIEIVEELQRLLAVSGQGPCKIVDLIQVVERVLYDLSDLGDMGAIRRSEEGVACLCRRQKKCCGSRKLI